MNKTEDMIDFNDDGKAAEVQKNIQESQDAAFLATFLSELSENVIALEQELIFLEKDPRNEEKINQLFRLFHNLKGSSSMMNFTILTDLAHFSESILDLARSKTLVLSQIHIDMLLEVLTHFNEIKANLKASGKEGKKRYFKTLSSLVDLAEQVHKPDEIQQTNVAQDVEKSQSSRDDEMIKVSKELIDQMMLLVGEFMLLKNRFDFLKVRHHEDHDLYDACTELDIFSGKLQRNILKLRLSPVRSLFASMHKVVRSTSKELKKEVEFETFGDETLLDRSIIDVLNEPLMHLIRNAVDHGVESKEQRQMANKPGKGHLSLKAAYKSGEIHIEIADDGAGLNVQKIKQIAIEKNLITAAQADSMSVPEAQQLIFLPGLSSAETISNISGRGVGMDVVKSVVKEVGGQIDILSELGIGTSFILKFPLSLAIIDCLGFTVGNQTFALPQSNVEEVISHHSHSMKEKLISVNNGSKMLMVRETPIPVLSLASAFKIEQKQSHALILVKNGRHRFALEVGEISGPLSIVSEPLPQTFAKKAPFSGITKNGDGSLLFLIDVAKLQDLVHTAEIARKSKGFNRGTAGVKEERTLMSSSDIRRLQQKIITFKNIKNFCMPVQRAKRIVFINKQQVQSIGSSNSSYVTLEGKTIPLIWLEEILLQEPRSEAQSYSLLLFNVKNVTYGIPMKEFLGIQRMPEEYDDSLCSRGILGSTILNQDTFLLVDLYEVVKMSKGEELGSDPGSVTKKINRVVVAEDDRFFASELIASLRHRGYQVDLFWDGMEAKEALASADYAKQVDLIITDIEMPRMNGIALTRWIRSNEILAKKPIIAYSAITSPEMERKIISAGALALVSKMNFEELTNQLEEISQQSADFLKSKMENIKDDIINRVVTFTLGADWFALPMKHIKEVSPVSKCATIPDAPEYMNKVTSFRGKMIPVLDLKTYFLMGENLNDATEQAIVEVGDILFAVRVDRIGEVLLDYQLAEGEGLPRFSAKESKLASFVKSVYRYDQRIITLFDQVNLSNLCQSIDDQNKEHVA